MALRKETPAPQDQADAAAETKVTPAGQFEAPDDDTVATPAANDPAPAPSAGAPASEQRAVQVAQQRAVSLTAGTALKKLQNVIPTEDLEALGFGTFPRITAGTDGFSVNKDELSLGKKIKFQVMSWNYIWLVTAGENNAEANKLIKSSHDGINLDGNEGTIEKYVAWLKSEGYEKAASKQYVEVYGFLLAYNEVQKDGSLKLLEIGEDDRQIHQVSLSPKSVGQWGRYMLESAMKPSTQSDTVVMTAVKKVNGPNTYGMATFSSKW